MRAFLRAVLAHVYIAWIHPFGDSNGRTARLVEFGILTAAGVPAISTPTCSRITTTPRGTPTTGQLNQASRSGGEPTPFLRYRSRASSTVSKSS